MKKFFLLLVALIGAFTAQAGTYAYLTFETTDGAKVSVPVEALSLTVSGNTLTAGSQLFVLANLAKMYFTETDEGGTTGIESMVNGLWTIDNATEIYDLQGKKVKNGELSNGKLSNSQLPKGAYIVKTKEKTYKLIVK